MEKKDYILIFASAAVGVLGAWSVIRRRKHALEARTTVADDAEADIIRRFRPAIDRAMQKAHESRVGRSGYSHMMRL